MEGMTECAKNLDSYGVHWTWYCPVEGDTNCDRSLALLARLEMYIADRDSGLEAIKTTEFGNARTMKRFERAIMQVHKTRMEKYKLERAGRDRIPTWVYDAEWRKRFD
jgi:hypothetical protein